MVKQSNRRDIPRDLSDEALRWIVRLNSGEATSADSRAFADWRSQSDLHDAAAQEAEEIWGDATGLRQSGDGMAVLPDQEPNGPSRRKLLGFAGLATIGAAGGWIALERSGAFADYATETGKTREVLLEDNSRVLLNARSAINLDFAHDRREITLLHGEALFEVARDPSRPFRVRAGPVSVTAVGTAFNVDASGLDGVVRVAAVEHTVRLQAGKAGQVDLHEGEAASTDANGRIGAVRKIDPTVATAWRSGSLIAEDERLDEVVQALRAYSSGWIVVRDDAATLKVNAVLDLRTPDAALDALATGLPIKLTRLSGLLTIIGMR